MIQLPAQFRVKFEDHSTVETVRVSLFCTRCREPQEVILDAAEVPAAKTSEAVFAQGQLMFRECPQCNSWVCRDGCWNAIKGVCETCSGKPFEGKETEPTDEHAYSSILGAVDSEGKN